MDRPPSSSHRVYKSSVSGPSPKDGLSQPRTGPAEPSPGQIQIFVGGISPQVNEKIFREFFEKFGPLLECRLVVDKATLQSRGFGFITFEDSSDADKVINKTLKILGKEIECKDALSKDDSNARVNNEKLRKIFIGGLPQEATEKDLEDYFHQYGEIRTTRIIYKQDSKASRGFGFIIFKDRMSAQAVIDRREDHYIKGKWVDCKSAILRQEMKAQQQVNSV